MPPESTGPVWTRLPDEPAPERPRVTRAAIVAAAITLADEEGLSAVSIRRVAAALDTRPMGLYSHIGRKDDLVDLMIDRCPSTSFSSEATTAETLRPPHLITTISFPRSGSDPHLLSRL